MGGLWEVSGHFVPLSTQSLIKLYEASPFFSSGLSSVSTSAPSDSSKSIIFGSSAIITGSGFGAATGAGGVGAAGAAGSGEDFPPNNSPNLVIVVKE